jgi:hypothetical protein
MPMARSNIPFNSEELQMLNTMPILSPDKPAKLGSYAGFPGTGPTGEVCSRCALQVADRSKFICDKFRQMTGRKGSPISPGTAACRYFQARPAFNRAMEG